MRWLVIEDKFRRSTDKDKAYITLHRISFALKGLGNKKHEKQLQLRLRKQRI